MYIIGDYVTRARTMRPRGATGREVPPLAGDRHACVDQQRYVDTVNSREGGIKIDR